MESFYSIIYYKPSSVNDEHLAVGFFAGGGEGPFFYLSTKRLRLMKDIVHNNTYLSVHRHLKSFRQKVDNYRKQNDELLLFDPHYSKDEFEKLSKEAKGAIRYSAPVTINEWLDQEVFDILVHRFLGEKKAVKTASKPIFHLKWRAFYQSNRCEGYRRDVLLNDLNPKVEMNVKLDLLQEKEELVIKAMDFDLSDNNVAKNKYELELIADALKNFRLICVYPTPLKNSGKDRLQSIVDTHKHISFINFKDFKLNH